MNTFRKIQYYYFKQTVAGCLIAVLFLLFSNSITAQIDYHFTQLTKEDGLPEGIVFKTFMDSRHFVWLCTQEGLYRWDGTNLRSYQDGDNLPEGLRQNAIRDILEDKNGHLWIASVGGGMYELDPMTDSITSYLPDPSNTNSISGGNVVALHLDEEEILWIGMFDAGLCSFDKKQKQFRHYPLAKDIKGIEDAYKKNTVNAITSDREDLNVLWLAVNNGIAKANKKTGEVTTYGSQAPNSTGMSTHDILMDEAGDIWVSTYGGGIVRFNKQKIFWEYFTPKPEAWKQLSSHANILHSAIPKSEEELWVCSEDMGFGVFNKKSGGFNFFTKNPEDELSILTNTAWSVNKDRDGRTWVSNGADGISYIDPYKQSFWLQSWPNGNCPTTSTEEKSDIQFHSKSNQFFLIQSGCHDLYVFDKNFRFKKEIKAAGYENELTSYTAVEVDKDGRIWLSSHFRNETQDGITTFKPSFWQYDETRELVVPANLPALENKIGKKYDITDILADDKGNIWLATHFHGLVKIDRSLQSVQLYHYKENTPAHEDWPLHKLMLDKKGDIWAATLGKGVFKFDPSTEQFTAYSKGENKGDDLSGERIKSIIEDADGLIWVGTSSDGIDVIDPMKEEDWLVRHFTQRDGLPSLKMDNLVLDGNGAIWVMTQTGICRFNKESGWFQNFDEKDGVEASFLFNQGMSKLPNGKVFITENKGFYVVDPNDFQKTPAPLHLTFTFFKIFENTITPPRPLDHLDQLTLNHNENFFTIGFSAINYTDPQKTRYAYQLEGYDGDWIYPLDNRSAATYTGVPSGEYIFKIKASNGSGVWSSEKTLAILVTPPWWRTWWATLLWITIIAALLWWAYQFQLRRRLAKEETQRLKELDEFKTKLYANITHEFRTPLTLIIGNAGQLENKFERFTDGEKIQRIKSVRTNGQRLLNLVNQILDLRKLEVGSLKTDYQHGNAIALLNYITDSFHSHAAAKGIDLSFTSDQPELMMDYDKDKLIKILNNLISNAVKFTPNGGKIRVSTTVGEKELKVEVKDSGKGIPPEDLPHIFQRFYQVEKNKKDGQIGSGIGLSLTKELIELMGGRIKANSILDIGTTFLFNLPVRKEATHQIDSLFDDSIATASPMVFEGEATTTTVLPENAPVVLIVEDNPEVAQFVASCLQQHFKIELAENGQIGIDKAVELIPDLIISDVMMPEKDGFEVCGFVKNDERTSHIPLILLTALREVEHRIEGLRRGADAYLAKPFNEDELLMTARRLLLLRSKLQERYAQLKTDLPKIPVLEEPQPTKKKKSKTPVADFDWEMEDAFFQKVLNAIKTNYTDADYGVDQLCKDLYISYSQLQRKLAAIMGRTPLQAIRDYRLLQAQQLLLSPKFTISEVAYDTGFNDPSYFTRIFTRQFGVTPTQFREQSDTDQ